MRRIIKTPKSRFQSNIPKQNDFLLKPVGFYYFLVLFWPPRPFLISKKHPACNAAHFSIKKTYFWSKLTHFITFLSKIHHFGPQTWLTANLTLTIPWGSHHALWAVGPANFVLTKPAQTWHLRFLVLPLSGIMARSRSNILNDYQHQDFCLCWSFVLSYSHQKAVDFQTSFLVDPSSFLFFSKSWHVWRTDQFDN